VISELRQLMLDHSPHMMLLVDPTDLRIIVANQVAEHVLGYTAAQLMEMQITDIESSLQDVFYWEDVHGGISRISTRRRANTSAQTVRKSW